MRFILFATLLISCTPHYPAYYTAGTTRQGTPAPRYERRRKVLPAPQPEAFQPPAPVWDFHTPPRRDEQVIGVVCYHQRNCRQTVMCRYDGDTLVCR
jgi:hypothetical protein